MEERIEALERRVASIKDEMAELRAIARSSGEDEPLDGPAWSATIRDVLAKMGLADAPLVSQEELRRLFIESGWDVNGTAARDEIVAMREE